VRQLRARASRDGGPKFGTEGNNYVYFYYTHKRSACPVKQSAAPRNPYKRVSRFKMDGDTIVKDSEEVLVDGIPSPNGNHNASDLHFGNDGKLYVSVGDGSCDYVEKTTCQYENDASRDGNVLLGKILRINPDGTTPPDNPYTGSNSAPCSNESGGIARAREGERCQEIFVSGFRNPFRFAIDPDAARTRLFINDVGGQRWEEVDEAVFGVNGTLDSGNDYGWNVCEGRHDNPYRGGKADCNGATFTGPIHKYNHSTGCESVTAGAFMPDDARWPDDYRGAYLYGDFVCGRIFSLTPKDGGHARTTFAAGLGLRSAVAMDFGPYKSTRKALYYATFQDGGMIRRNSYEAGNQYPIADLKSTDGKNYIQDLTMSFDASGSTDAEGQPLTYEWDFEEGAADNKTTTTPTTTHDFSARGEYTVSVTVRDDTTGISDPPARMTVYSGDTPPNTLSITSPADESTFTVPPKEGDGAGEHHGDRLGHGPGQRRGHPGVGGRPAPRREPRAHSPKRDRGVVPVPGGRARGVVLHRPAEELPGAASYRRRRSRPRLAGGLDRPAPADGRPAVRAEPLEPQDQGQR
jgi:glucose/arabinose dehydrogenase